MNEAAVRRSPNEPRPVLPVCILATASPAPGATHGPDILCMRMSCPGAIERAFSIERGVASAIRHGSDRIETLGDLPTDPATVAAHVGAAVDGALLVTWDLDALQVALGTYHPAPHEIVANAVLDLDLQAIAFLVAPPDDAPAPTLESLAVALALTPPGEGVRELGWFLARAIRRLSASATWLTRVCALGFDERAILETCVERLGVGAKQYGPWHLDDARDLARETYEEVIDALHYAAAGLLRMREAARAKEVG